MIQNQANLEYNITYNGSHSSSLIHYLNENPFDLYLLDNSCIKDHELIKGLDESDLLIDLNKIEALDWDQYGTDITVEFGACKDNKSSIHDVLKEKILAENNEVVVYDHGTGELADFIILTTSDQFINIELVHVKGSSGTAPGNRVGDVYEVCGQAVKCLVWTTKKQTFFNNLNRRLKDNDHKLIRGTRESIQSIIESKSPLSFTITIVQPGIPKNDLTPKISNVLASTNDYIRRFGRKNYFKVISSN